MNKSLTNRPSVLVMMATYNGEKFVAEQIDSILAQQDIDVHLLISDDGSRDRTSEICARYARDHANVVFSVNEKNKGLAKNFMDMLYGSDADAYDYFAFSDQDDYWLPIKLSKAIEKIEASGPGPRLYYSDVCNVDENLEGGSGEYGAFGSYADSLGLLLTINWASGCTMVFNSKFASVLQMYEPKSWPRIHDGWIHLVARAINAQVPDLEHSYIKRRISGQNQVGERGLNKLDWLRIKSYFQLFGKSDKHGFTVAADMLLKGYGNQLNENDLLLVERFVKGRDSIAIRFALAFDTAFKQPYPLESLLFKLKMLLNVY